MRKFKHKITGYIATETSSEKNYKVSEPKNFTIPKWIVENSNDWEEVKEYPKIVSFRVKNTTKRIRYINKYGMFPSAPKEEAPDSRCNEFSEKSLLEDALYEIYQVAVSETEVFTLGDKVEIIMNRPKYSKSTIDRFELETNGCISVRVSEYCSVSLHDIKKAPEVLFVTEDGIEIFKGDKFYYISIRNPNPVCHSGYAQEESAMNTNYKYFSTIEAAKKYIDENKPIYSKKQIEEALNYGTYIFVDVELFKSRLGL
jgi:hypothetical protein